MTRLEKNKYMRERLYYQREKQTAMYDIAHRNYKNCDKIVEDNMVKQAKTVMKISKEDYDKHFKDFDVMQEVGDISK